MAAQDRDLTMSPVRPGLTALVVYLRPAPRGRLLTLLASLGIFVIEHQGAQHAIPAAYSTRSDFVIVVGNHDPAHTALARELLETLSSVLVAIVPAGTDESDYVQAGATAVIDEAADDDDFAIAIAPAVRKARLLRGLGQAAAEYIIFRDVRFRTMPPELEREGRRVPLTRVESEVLTELWRSLGKPVPTELLERRLSTLSQREEVHGGYVKTVILRIRRKVDEVGGNPAMLRNVRGYGYMLVA